MYTTKKHGCDYVIQVDYVTDQEHVQQIVASSTSRLSQQDSLKSLKPPTSSTSPDSWARIGISRVDSVNVERQARVAGSIRSREGDETRSRQSTATSSNPELGTRQVELRRIVDVQSNVLAAEQVVAGAQAGGDGGVEVAHLGDKGRPLADLVAVLVNLEPDVARGHPRVDVLAVGHAGQVEEDGAGVAHAVARGEADAGAGGDGLHGGGRAAGLLVAADEGRAHALDGVGARVVLRLADILPLGRGDAIDDGAGEEVWICLVSTSIVLSDI